MKTEQDDRLLAGISLPPSRGVGRVKDADLPPWLDAVGILIARGVDRPSQMARILGIGYDTAKLWMEKTQEKWAATLEEERVNWRREKLFQEMEEVSQVAWAGAMDAGLADKDKVAYLKVIVDSNKRKASLCGLDQQKIVFNATVNTTNTLNIVSNVEKQFNLAPGALESIGRDAAMFLSVPLEEQTRMLAPVPAPEPVIEAEFETPIGESEPVPVTAPVATPLQPPEVREKP